MPDTKPAWMEDWHAVDANGSEGESVWTVHSEGVWTFSPSPTEDGWCTDNGQWSYGVTEARARFAAASPAMARALLAVEWEGRDPDGIHVCPYCGCEPLDGHEPECALDAALTAAGLQPEERDAARERMKR